MTTSFVSSARFLSFTIACSSRESVDLAVQNILSRIKPNRSRRYVAVLNVKQIYDAEPPYGGAHPFKLIVYSPVNIPDGCVIITNLRDGWSSMSYLLAKEHRQFQIQVISTSSAEKYLQHKFEIWRNGKSTRLVMVMRDETKFEFFARGEAESFEKPENYAHRRKKDRLNRSTIIECLKEAGIDIDIDEFWTSESDAVYFEEIRA